MREVVVFFVGINTGYSISFIKSIATEQQQSTTTNSTLAPQYINIGVQLGYNYYLMDFLGLRGYVDYNYGFKYNQAQSIESQQTTNTSVLEAAHTFSANLDMLFNIFSSDSIVFGAYAGIGLGYSTMSIMNKANEQGVITNTTTQQGNGFILPINLGLSLTANEHHRFELGFKIPTLGITYTPPTTQGENQPKTITRNFTTTIGYSYIF